MTAYRPIHAAPTAPRTGTLLCYGCDAPRDTERAFCASCGEATNSYAYTPGDQPWRIDASKGEPALSVYRSAARRELTETNAPRDDAQLGRMAEMLAEQERDADRRAAA